MSSIRKYSSKVSAFVLIVAIFALGFALGSSQGILEAQAKRIIGDTEDAFAPLFEVFDAIQARYIDKNEIDVPTLVDGAIRGMVEALGDDFSGYLSPQAFNRFNSDMTGSVEGIGVVIRTIEATGEIEVVSVIEGAAARAAGVLPGDIFWEVDGRSVVGLNQTELADLVRGPAGTQVQIRFKRGDTFVDFTITRVRFSVPIIESRIVDNDIAYVKLSEFNSVAVDRIRDAVDALDVNSRRGLIFDLRGNPGGLLSSAVDVGSFFIEDGVLLYETFADGREEIFRANGKYGNISVPIVVLVDEASASASELVAGAMQVNGIATVVGEVTFGKGTVQTIQALSNSGALRLTIARYLLPNRSWIHKVGVTPDILVEWNPRTPEEMAGVDPQLQAAIDFLSTP